MEVPKANPYADLFRGLYVMPRSSALGGSNMSIARDGTTLSNPANLASDSTREIALSYANFYHNVFSTSMLSFVTPVGNRAGISLSLNYIFVPDIELYREGDVELTPSGDPVFSGNPEIATASDILLRFAYGTRVTVGEYAELGAGAALNTQRRRLPDVSGHAIGVDVGLRAHLIPADLTLAMLVENATTTYVRWSSSYRELASPHLRLGVAWQHDFPYIYGRSSITYSSPDLFMREGINYYEAESDSAGVETIPGRSTISKRPGIVVISGRYGLEYIIMESLALRLGKSPENVTFGAGINLLRRRAALDFAYLLHDMAGTYQLSMTYRW